MVAKAFVAQFIFISLLRVIGASTTRSGQAIRRSLFGRPINSNYEALKIHQMVCYLRQGAKPHRANAERTTTSAEERNKGPRKPKKADDSSRCFLHH